MFSEMLPSSRVRDEANLLSEPFRVLLSDTLDNLSHTQHVEFYVVILPQTPVAEATQLCDRWQTQWIPKGEGGVFVYSVVDKKYSFSATQTTLDTVGPEKLQDIFRSAVENPPLMGSFDTVISLPIFRIVASINQTLLENSRTEFKEADSEVSRWELIAALAGLLAIVGWGFSFSKLFKTLNRSSDRRSSDHINIPPAGMAYRNPVKRSRSRRKDSSRGEGRDRY